MSRCHRTAVVVLFLALCTACADSPTAPGSAGITYKVVGSAATVIVAYAAPGGTQTTTATPPWSYSFDATKGQLLFVSASNKTAAGATVTVEIWRKGLLFKTATNSGPYASASVTGVF